MIFNLCDNIETHINEIKTLFLQNVDHKHADNYIKNPLFEYTKFARLGWEDDRIIYYSAGIERPEYKGSIRIMSRHTRDIDIDWGGWEDDIIRGTDTLDQSVDMAKKMGYTDIWVSREESSLLLGVLQNNSSHYWDINFEQLHHGESQWVMRLQNQESY